MKCGSLKDSSKSRSFDAICRLVEYSTPDGPGTYHLVTFTVESKFLLEHGFVPAYIPDAEDQDPTNTQRIHEEQAASGGAHMPPIQCVITDDQLWSVVGDKQRWTKTGRSCTLKLPTQAGLAYLRIWDGGGRRSIMEKLQANGEDTFIEVQLSDMPPFIESLQFETYNSKMKPVSKTCQAVACAAIAASPEGERLLREGGAGMTDADANVKLQSARAARVAMRLRNCSPEQPLYGMIKSHNDDTCPKRPKGSPKGTPHPPKRTVDLSVFTDLQTGFEGRRNDKEVSILTPPAEFLAMSEEDRVLLFHDITKGLQMAFPQAWEAWRNRQSRYVLTDNRGMKAAIAFAWKVLHRLDVMNVKPNRTGSQFWFQIFSSLAPHLPVAAIHGVSANHVEFWDKKAPTWYGRGGNVTSIGAVVIAMEDACDHLPQKMNGLIERALNESSVVNFSISDAVEGGPSDAAASTTVAN